MIRDNPTHLQGIYTQESQTPTNNETNSHKENHMIISHPIFSHGKGRTIERLQCAACAVITCQSKGGATNQIYGQSGTIVVDLYLA